jgi:hypothetical protein
MEIDKIMEEVFQMKGQLGVLFPKVDRLESSLNKAISEFGTTSKVLQEDKIQKSTLDPDKIIEIEQRIRLLEILLDAILNTLVENGLTPKGISKEPLQITSTPNQ